MAKRTKKATAATTALVTAASLEQFTIGGNLDVSDVLSVVTSRAEDKYSAELGRCRELIEEIEADSQRVSERIKELAAKEATQPHRETEKALRVLVKPLGGSVSLQAVGRCGVGVPLNDDGLLTAKITVKPEGRHSYGTEFSVTAKPSKELLGLGSTIEENRQRVKELQTEALAWKRKLNNVPMLERRYRSRIAEAKLRTNEDGQALLAMLTSDLDEAILALPSV